MIPGLGQVRFYEGTEPETRWAPGEVEAATSALRALVGSGALRALPEADPLEAPLEFHRNPNLAGHGENLFRQVVNGVWQIDISPEIFGSRSLTRLTIGHEIGHVYGSQRGFSDLNLEERNIRSWELDWGERFGASAEQLQRSRFYFLECFQRCP